jgi:tetratricopeptide (TPR) repeat protein
MRHRPIAGVPTAAIAIGLIVCLASYAIAYVAFARADEAERLRHSAEDASNVALARMKNAEMARQSEETRRIRAERNTNAAIGRRRLAEAAVVSMLREIRDKPRGFPDLNNENAGLRKAILLSGVQALEKLAGVSGDEATDDDPGLAKRAKATTFTEIAAIYLEELNEPDKALNAYRTTFDLLAEMVCDQPKRDEARADLAAGHIRLGDIQMHLPQGARHARNEFLSALAIRQDILDHPRDKHFQPSEVRKMVADAQQKLAIVSTRLGDPACARKHYQVVVDFYETVGKSAQPSAELDAVRAELFQALADLSWRLGDAKGLEENQDRCLEIRMQLVGQSNKPGPRQDLALAYAAFGDAHLRFGRVERAEDCYRKSLDLLKILAANDTNPTYQSIEANDLFRLGTALLLQNRQSDAGHSFEQALQIQLELAKADRDSVGRPAIVMALAKCGSHEKAASIAGKIRQKAGTDSEQHYQLACGFAVCATAVGLGHQRYDQYVRDALDCLGRAIDEDYKDYVAVETELDLRELHGQPAFRDLIARIRMQAGVK